MFVTGVLAGCSQDNSVYNPSSGELNNPLSSITVPSGFSFSTTKVVKATVKVNDTFNGQSDYGVFLYGDDPSSVTDPTALATGNARNGSNFTASITVPAATDYVFVKTVTPANLYEVRAFAINSDNTVNADFTSSTLSSAKGTRSTVKRAPNNPSFDTSVFPTSIPAGISEKPASGDDNFGTYKITSGGTYSNLKGTYYISAPNQTVTISSMTNQNETLYIMPNTNVVLTSDPGLTTSVITIDAGATLTCNSGLQIQSSSKLYNRGTFVCNGTFTYNLSSVYNNGVFSVTKLESSGDGNSSGFYNYYALNVSENFTFNGGGTFINESGASATITGATYHKGDNEYFLNQGTYHTGTMSITASSVNNYNDCKLFVDGLLSFDAQHTLTNMAGSYLECGSLSMANNGAINMYQNSFLNVKGTTYFNSLRSSGNGINGVGTGYAVAELGTTTSYNCGDNSLYNGKLYIHVSNRQSITEHQNDNLYTYDKTSVSLSTGPDEHPNIVIASTDCNPGYNYTSTPKPTPFTQTYEAVYAMEDNYPSYGDYDMNDIVVYLKITGNGSDQSTNKLQSATITSKVLAYGVDYTNGYGVQLKNITFTGTGVESNSNGSVLVLKDDIAGYYRVNSSDRPSSLSEAITTAAITTTNTVNFATPIDATALIDNNVNFFSTVNKGEGVTEIHLKGYNHTGNTDRQHITVTSGNVDNRKENSVNCFETLSGWMWGMSFAKDSQWLWPYEHSGINKVYSKFSTWVESNNTQDTDWYKYRDGE